DVIPFQQVVTTCLPCIAPCDAMFCDKSCVEPMKMYTVVWDDLNLDDKQYFNTTLNETGTVAATYFVHVKALTGSGLYTTATSNGITIDTTPPLIDILYHLDLSVSDKNKVYIQGQNRTIGARWDGFDLESKVVGFEWAIGTEPFLTDIQSFRWMGTQK
ncbi:unnamed protein product, partial [Owenia fusiformis]